MYAYSHIHLSQFNLLTVEYPSFPKAKLLYCYIVTRGYRGTYSAHVVGKKLDDYLETLLFLAFS